jgi:hypothetical protein
VSAVSVQVDRATAAYLREVRKLRSRHRTNPAKLSAALTELNRTRDARPAPARPKTVTVRPARRTPAPAHRPTPVPALNPAFADEVEHALRTDGGSLRYTTRCRLLARAERLGVSRFDANLIIASVLHHHHPVRNTPAVPKAMSPLFWLSAVAIASLAAIAVWG